ncbi:DUF4913 domain-containing protein [Longispora albida]|uniref:DUF4913 domain-containing protein n=1 Tax=Longispora albida TaxID=203523 RepID=UPI0003676F96|nr:DUF4913 domain-containing protein [Longispora albida]
MSEHSAGYAQHRTEAERLTEAERQLGMLSSTVAEMVALMTGPASAPPVSWFDATPEEAGRMLAGLAGWGARVLGRYCTLPPCWYRHPDTVEELLALHAAWRAAYRNPSARPGAGAEWHDRLDRVLGRLLGAESRLRRCLQQGEHRPRPVSVAPPGADTIAGYARLWSEQRDVLDAAEQSAPPAPQTTPQPPDPGGRSPWMSDAQYHQR